MLRLSLKSSDMTAARIAAVAVASVAAVALATTGSDNLGRGAVPSVTTESIVKEYLTGHPEGARRLVTDYLATHPEVLQEALVELMKLRLSTSLDKAAAVKSNAAALFHSGTRVALGNPEGDITLVEFVDYNCGFCRRALSDMLELIKTDPDLKIVLIEHPVLGAGSTEAARVAIAVQAQDRSAAKYLDFHRRLLSSPGPANKARALAVAAELGLDAARLEATSASPDVEAALQENKRLARAIGVRGTPSYVIADSVLFGALGIATLKEKIAAARRK